MVLSSLVKKSLKRRKQQTLTTLLSICKDVQLLASPQDLKPHLNLGVCPLFEVSRSMLHSDHFEDHKLGPRDVRFLPETFVQSGLLLLKAPGLGAQITPLSLFLAQD